MSDAGNVFLQGGRVLCSFVCSLIRTCRFQECNNPACAGRAGFAGAPRGRGGRGGGDHGGVHGEERAVAVDVCVTDPAKWTTSFFRDSGAFMLDTGMVEFMANVGTVFQFMRRFSE